MTVMLEPGRVAMVGRADRGNLLMSYATFLVCRDRGPTTTLDANGIWCANSRLIYISLPTNGYILATAETIQRLDSQWRLIGEIVE